MTMLPPFQELVNFLVCHYHQLEEQLTFFLCYHYQQLEEPLTFICLIFLDLLHLLTVII